ncbi:MAG: sulfatase-like hydrolase/transferase [Bacteroidia bacterium]
MNKLKVILLIAIGIGLHSCKDDCEDKEVVNPVETTPNILLIIADDMGKDATNGFSEGSIKPTTPHIDAFKNSGLSFDNFWAYPTCSPTRSSILTGKYGYRTGVKWASDELSQSEKSLQSYINENTNDKYATAIAGKWHLSGSRGNFNPEVFGIDYYAGLIRGQAQSYYNWLLTEDGSGTIESEYATTKFTDLGIDWIKKQEKPWFMWLAYNAPHTPFHVPPAEMHNQGSLPPYSDGMEEMPYYMAAIEAMDYQIGRLLDSIPTEELENTIIIFIGDNGSPNEVAQVPYSSFTAKGSLYQGGINVPMFITGKGVSRIGDDHNLITSSDLFATIAELAGVSVKEIHDSKSFKSLLVEPSTIRKFQYSEKDNGSTDVWTISNGSHKLIEYADADSELYNLTSDPYEQNNLLEGTLTSEDSAAKLVLEEEVARIRQ